MKLGTINTSFIPHTGVDITALAKSVESPLSYERIETITHGQGRNRTVETLLTRVETAADIRTWESYRPPTQPGKQLRHRKRPALNAVLVRMWRNHEQQNGPRIYLTNGPVDDPWSVVDLYDDRSWIENGLFRNSKQFFTLTRWFPKRSTAGVRSHLTFVMLMLATATAYRLWDKAQAGVQAALTAAAKTTKTVTHRIVNRQTGEILPDSRSLLRQAGHLAAPPLPRVATSRRHRVRPSPLYHSLALSTRLFPITCSKDKASSVGATSYAKKTTISSSSSSLTVTPSSTPTSSWSLHACLCPVSHPNSARVTTSYVVTAVYLNHLDCNLCCRRALLLQFLIP